MYARLQLLQGQLGNGTTATNGQKGRASSPQAQLGKNNATGRGTAYPPSDPGRGGAVDENYDSTIQLSRPKEAEKIELSAHPKQGESFSNWQDTTRERVSRACPFPNRAFAWILRVEDPECTYEELRNPGALASLDGKLADALWKNLPPDSSPLRQKLNNLKTKERKDSGKLLSGRQILWIIYKSFQINEGDKQITDLVKLQRVTLGGNDLQQFKYNWDQCLLNLTVQPPEEQLKIFFLLQLEQLPIQHEFTMEYKIWCADVRATDRTYEQLSDKVDDYLLKRNEQKNRQQILGQSLPDLKLNAKSAKAAGGGGATNGPCYGWQNYGECKKPGCKYDHSPALKNTGGKGKGKKGLGKGKSKGKGKGGKSNASQKGGAGTPRNNGAERTKVVTDLAQVCRNHLQGKCKAGSACKYHHNEPCKFFPLGTCSYGDKCPFPHVATNARAATAAPAPKATAKAKAKAKAGAGPSADGSNL